MHPTLQHATDSWLRDRQRARVDLLFLCREVLRYKDVSPTVHGPILDTLQHFQGGHDVVNPDTGQVVYTPAIDLWRLNGPRTRLMLYPRGHLKTTIITLAHSIQWLINYQDIRLLISTAIGEQAKRMLIELKAHFQYNEHFRFLFPDFCPHRTRVGDFGSQTEFTLPNRRRRWLKEPSVSVNSVGHVMAGGHYEVIKHSDLVDKENVRTPAQIQQVKDHFTYMNPLLERGPCAPYHGWTDVEGTRYDHSDLYGDIILNLEKNPTEDTTTLIGKAIKDDGSSLWPERFPKEELDAIMRQHGVWLFNSQYQNNPVDSIDGLCPEDKIQFFPRDMANRLLPYLRLHVTIDLHGMEPQTETNDSTVLTLAGFDRDGRMLVIDIQKGHFSPHQVIDHIFDLYRRYPQIIDFKIEKEAHARVLLPFLQREMFKRNLYPVMVAIKRDNRTSKQHRIRALQPWFQTAIIRFCEDITCKTDLIQEIVGFPRYNHDDILDTLADQMRNRDDAQNYDVIPNAPRTQPQIGGGSLPGYFTGPKFLEFDPTTGKQRWSGDAEDAGSQYYDPKLGI